MSGVSNPLIMEEIPDLVTGKAEVPCLFSLSYSAGCCYYYCYCCC